MRVKYSQKAFNNYITRDKDKRGTLIPWKSGGDHCGRVKVLWDGNKNPYTIHKSFVVPDIVALNESLLEELKASPIF